VLPDTPGLLRDVVAIALRDARPLDFVTLTKPRIVALILLTTAVGFYLGATPATGLLLLVNTLVGTTLVAAGTNGLNQVAEWEWDGRMRRTRARPIPAGRLSAGAGAVFAWTVGLAGIAYLAAFVNGITALLAGLTLLSYVFLYTPLKRKTSLATLVGAVPGALPVVGGWTAAGGVLGTPAWSLFWILFLWQLPHFLALSWMFREDYRRAGFKMLSVDDPDGRLTFRQATLYATALLPVSLVPALWGLVGRVYFFGAVALGVWFAWSAFRATLDVSPARARRLFLVSITYLPALFALLAVNKLG